MSCSEDAKGRDHLENYTWMGGVFEIDVRAAECEYGDWA
jgi:hypothetical protein